MNDKLQEIVNFFELEEGYSKREIITDILDEIKELKGNAADEVSLLWGEDDLMLLEDFVWEFYVRLEEKMLNVIKSFQKEYQNVR